MSELLLHYKMKSFLFEICYVFICQNMIPFLIGFFFTCMYRVSLRATNKRHLGYIGRMGRGPHQSERGATERAAASKRGPYWTWVTSKVSRISCRLLSKIVWSLCRWLLMLEKRGPIAQVSGEFSTRGDAVVVGYVQRSVQTTPHARTELQQRQNQFKV